MVAVAGLRVVLVALMELRVMVVLANYMAAVPADVIMITVRMVMAEFESCMAMLGRFHQMRLMYKKRKEN